MANTNKVAMKMAICAVMFTAVSGCSFMPDAATTEPMTASQLTADPTKNDILSQPRQWQAFSTTAQAITGNITLTDSQLTFANQARLELMLIERNVDTGQTLYRVTSNTNPELLNGNRICGAKPIDYVLVQVRGDVSSQLDLQLMAYYYPETLSLSDLPLKPTDDMSRQMCALYTYGS